MARETDFEAMFRVEYPKLVSFGVGLLGDLDVARDLAQDTMAKASSNWSTVADADQPAAWLFRVMRNAVIDHQRRSGVEHRALRQLASRPQPGHEGAADTPFAELVAGLPERQRHIATLRYVNDLSIDQIAEIMTIAPGTVKAQLWKARRSVERRVSPNGKHATT